MAVVHSTTATGADDPTKEINKGEWNAVHTVEDGSFVAAKLSASSTDVVFGRSTTGAGNGEEITCTSAGRAIISSSSAMVAARTMSVPYIIYNSGASVSGAADTNENTLVTATAPANAIGANGFVVFEAWFLWTNSANNKTWRLYIGGTGGTLLYSEVLTTGGGAGAYLRCMIANANSTGAQTTKYIRGISGNFAQGAAVAAAIDTTSSVDFVLTAQKATGSETVTVLAALITLYSDGA